MAQRTKAAFKTTKNSRFADNTTGAIGADDSRDMYEDVADSAMFIDDNFIDEDSFATNSATKAPSQQSVKAYVLSQTGGAGLLSVTKTISTAEILSGNSSPVTVLAAQGAGTIIQPVGPIIWKWNYATAAFATNVVSRMSIGSVAFPFTANNSVISLANIRYEILAITDTDSTQANAENGAILWAVNSGNPTGGGTSTLTVHFKYFVITL